MPSIAHLFMGGMIGYFLHVISDKRFSKHHVLLLFLASYVGPDLGWITGIGYFTHTYAGYLVFALFLAFFYSYFTRFSPDLARRELVDNGCNNVPYTSAYLLACAGGIMHIYLDGVMNHQGNFHLFPGIGSIDEVIVSINDFFNMWYDPIVPVSAIIALVAGMGLVFAFIPFFLHALKTGGPRFALKAGGFVGVFMILYYVFGSLTTLHADGGAIVYVTLFWVIPIGLCALAMKWPAPRSPAEQRGRLKQQFIPLLRALDLLLGTLFLAAGIAVLVLVEPVVALATSAWAPLAAHEAALLSPATFLGIIFITIGGTCVLTFVLVNRRGHANVNVLLATGLVIAAGFACMILAGLAFTSGAAIVSIIFVVWPSAITIASPEGLLAVIAALGIVLAGLAGFNFVMGAGLLMRKSRAASLAFAMSMAFAWTIAGLYVCCLLSQNEAKRAFA